MPPRGEMTMKKEASEKHKEEKALYLECWTGCRWQSFHSTPQTGQPAGRWCRCPRSRTAGKRKTRRGTVRNCSSIMDWMQIANCVGYSVICIVIQPDLLVADGERAKERTRAEFHIRQNRHISWMHVEKNKKQMGYSWMGMEECRRTRGGR